MQCVCWCFFDISCMYIVYTNLCNYVTFSSYAKLSSLNSKSVIVFAARCVDIGIIMSNLSNTLNTIYLLHIFWEKKIGIHRQHWMHTQNLRKYEVRNLCLKRKSKHTIVCYIYFFSQNLWLLRTSSSYCFFLAITTTKEWKQAIAYVRSILNWIFTA